MQERIQSGTVQPAAAQRGRHCAGLVSYGVPFQLAAETPDLLARMRLHAPHGSTARETVPDEAQSFSLRRARRGAGYEVLAGERVLDHAAALDGALVLLGGHLMIHVAEHAPEYVFVHAGAVAWQGRALLLPGVSHAGKSTLVAELVRAGAKYYSDEFALLDDEGRVHPYTRDIRMRRPGADDQVPLPLEELDGVAGAGAVAVAMVAFTEFAENARWAPQAITSGHAVLEMLRHSTPVQRTPARVLAALSAAMRGATAWRSQRGEAAGTARALLASLAEGGRPA